VLSFTKENTFEPQPFSEPHRLSGPDQQVLCLRSLGNAGNNTKPPRRKFLNLAASAATALIVLGSLATAAQQ
jgi:hypothetical protein